MAFEPRRLLLQGGQALVQLVQALGAERANLAPIQPERLQAMLTAWEAWNDSMPPIPEDAIHRQGHAAALKRCML